MEIGNITWKKKEQIRGKIKIRSEERVETDLSRKTKKKKKRILKRLDCGRKA